MFPSKHIRQIKQQYINVIHMKQAWKLILSLPTSVLTYPETQWEHVRDVLAKVDENVLISEKQNHKRFNIYMQTLQWVVAEQYSYFIKNKPLDHFHKGKIIDIGQTFKPRTVFFPYERQSGWDLQERESGTFIYMQFCKDGDHLH